jgi:hypothetical protein
MGMVVKKRSQQKAAAAARVIAFAALGFVVMRQPGLAHAEDAIPTSRQVVILMRALAYDGNLKSRAGNTINIAILQKKGNAASETMANAMTKAFGALESTQVSGLPIVVSHMTYVGEEALTKAFTGAGIDFVYVCEGLDADLDAIKRVTHQMKVLSVGSMHEQVEKGLSIGIFEIESKCTILLNLQASRQEGVEFAADLLRLARVIR